MNLAPVYIEISASWLRALRGNDGLDVPLERAPSGQLTAECKQNLGLSLVKFLQRKSWQPRSRALCAIGASGVSLRRMTLPVVARDEFSKVLRLQIESEFPLAPEELAWGYRTLPSNGVAARQEILVGAIKKARIEEYAGILYAAGLSPIFTPAAMARSYLCPQPLGSCALLDLGQKQWELAVFEKGVPVALRVFPRENESNGSLSKVIGSRHAGGKIYVTTSNGALENVIAELRRQLGNDVERLETASAVGYSAAVLGLRKASEENAGPPLLLFQTAAKPASLGSFKFSQPVPKKWALRAAALLCALLVLPYGEALLLKGHLTKKLSTLKAGQGKFATIDHEFDFLRFIKQNGPPYLDALYLFAKAAPPGARFDAASMNRRGEISLRGSMHDAQQVTDFRSKLMDSGFFERVTVEEQVPTPDRQKVNVRITAQWKPVEKRAGLAIGPTREEIEKAKTNAVAQANAPGGALPPGMPPGLMLR